MPCFKTREKKVLLGRHTLERQATRHGSKSLRIEFGLPTGVDNRLKVCIFCNGGNGTLLRIVTGRFGCFCPFFESWNTWARVGQRLPSPARFWERDKTLYRKRAK